MALCDQVDLMLELYIDYTGRFEWLYSLATIAHPHHMCLWHKLLCGARTIVPKGRFPHSTTQ